jgi:hypothetical protein
MLYFKYLSSFSTLEMSTDKRALLIGINYTNTPNQLQGCINDVVEMKSLIIDAYGFNPYTIVTLRDDDPSNMPTRARILQELRTLLANATPTTQIFLHYSGHGTNITDTGTDETDRLDECIVPSDYLTAGFITDDEINVIAKGLKGIGLAIFDCCRSGTIMDLPFTGITTTSIEGFYCFSGCRDNEDAFEETMGTGGSNTGLPQGAMTMTFISTLRDLNYYPTLQTLYSAILTNLQQGGYSQTPQLTSTTPVGSTTPFPFTGPKEQLAQQLAINASLQAQLQEAQLKLEHFQPQSALVSTLQQQVQTLTGVQRQLVDLQIRDASNTILINQLKWQTNLVPYLQKQADLVPILQNQITLLPGLQMQIDGLTSQLTSQRDLQNRILVLQNQIKRIPV